MNFKAIIAYDGSRYDGWQKQNNTSNTIEDKFESVLSQIFNQSVEVNASGRTDAGVHARGQVCNFVVSDENVAPFQGKGECPAGQNSYVCKTIMKQINHRLPQDIRVIDMSFAPERFHARLHATGKHYSYTIDNGEVSRVFDRKYVCRLEQPLDIEAVKKAAAFLIGEHDFKSFCVKSKIKKSTVRRIDKIDISADNGLIRFDFYGNGFLYNMIRIIMGTLIEIGLGQREPTDIVRILQAGKRSEAGFLAAASGLFLEEVFY